MNAGYMTIRLSPTGAQAELMEKTMDCCGRLWNRMIADEARVQNEFGRRLIPTPAKYKREFPELKEVDSLALTGLHHALLGQFQNHDYNPHDYAKPAPVARMESYTTYSKLSKGGFVIRLEDGGIRLPKLGLVPLAQYPQLSEYAVIQSAIVQKENGNFLCKIKYEIAEDQAVPAQEKQPA